MRVLVPALVLVAFTGTVAAATFTVTNTNDAGAGSLRDAIAQANLIAPPNTVNFDPSVTGTITLTTGAITVEQGPLTITGPGAAILTIDGNAAGRIFTILESAAASCPLPSAPTDFLVSISGLTLANGRAGGGGAIFSAHSLALDSVVIRNSTARVAGAVNYVYQYPNQSLTISNSTLTNNIATAAVADTSAQGGGAIRVGDGCSRVAPVALTITNSTISNNASQPVSFPGRGGAIASFSYVDIAITDSRIVGNHIDAPNPPVSQYAGGGIYASVPKSVTIVRSEIAQNNVNDVTGTGSTLGGGIYVVNDDPTLQSAGSETHLTLVNASVSQNGAASTAGALLAYGNIAVEIDNSTISDNSAPPTRPTGILVTTGPTNPPATGNATAPTLTLQSTILANNGDGVDLGVNSVAIPTFTVNASHSLIGTYCTTCGIGISGGGNLIGLDPRLDSLAWNGGPTRTQSVLGGSPAIDAGSNPLALTSDQRGPGFARTQGAATDMGAFETHPLVVTNANDSGAGSLRAVVAQADADPGPNVITFDPAVTGSIVLTGGPIAIHDGVSIYGPGAGTLALDGNASGRIFTILATNPACPAKDGPDYTVLLSNLRLTNGRAGSASGGAIFSGHTLGLENLVIDHNASLQDGGAVTFVTQYPNQELFVYGTTFDSNTAQPSGAGLATGGAIAIYERCTGSPVTQPVGVDIIDSTFTGNQAKPTTGGGFGGAIGANSYADITITGSRFRNNAVVAPNPPVAGTNYFGGALLAGSRSLYVADSEFSGNQVQDATGTSTLAFGGALFVLNTAQFRQSAGGAMPAQIVNSTVTANAASAAAGAMVAFGNVGLEIDNSTIASNTAGPSQPGGLALGTGPTIPPSASNALPPTLTLVSSILANNAVDDVHAAVALLPALTVNATNSLIRAICPNPTCAITVAGTGNLQGVDPKLGPLAHNGGPSQTMALLAGSPAIDHGGNPLGLANDQRGPGFPRVLNGTADMGAYEGFIAASAPLLQNVKSRKTHGAAIFDLTLAP